MRLDDAIVYFLGQWAIEGPTPATVRTYKFQLKWLAKWAASVGKTNLADLTPDVLRAAMAAKMAGARARSSNFKGGEAAAHSLVMAARCMAAWLRKQGLPVADLSTVAARKPPERVQPRIHQDEFQAIERAILHRLVQVDSRVPRVAIARDLALIYMLADTGLRISEVCAMTIESVDLEHGAVMIPGKGRKERALSIVDANDPRGGITLRLLAEWISARQAIHGTQAHRWLWVSLRGRRLTPDSLRTTVLAPLCEAAGLPSNRPPHTFRRTHFTESYKADPRMVDVLAQRMGWSQKSHQMVEVYTRGANVDIARSTPIPSIGARWAADGPNVPVTSGRVVPIFSIGVGPPNGGKVNGRAVPSRRGKDTDSTANQPPRGGRRLKA